MVFITEQTNVSIKVNVKSMRLQMTLKTVYVGSRTAYSRRVPDGTAVNNNNKYY